MILIHGLVPWDETSFMFDQVCHAQWKPMFVFDGALFRLTANGPTSEPSFQFAPRSNAPPPCHAFDRLPSAIVKAIAGSGQVPEFLPAIAESKARYKKFLRL